MSPFDFKEGEGVNSEMVSVDDISHDLAVQAREEEDPDTIEEYAALMKEGVEFPPIHLLWDTESGTGWIVDGNHRYLAAKKAGKRLINAIVMNGTLQEAKLYACRANRTNGLSRTNKDKRRAVIRAIVSPLCREWSARKIAKFVGVSNRFVSNVINQRADKIAAESDGETEMPLPNEQTEEVHEEEIQDEEQELAQILEVKVDTTKSPERAAESMWSAAVKHNAGLSHDLLAAWISTFAQRLRTLAFDELAADADPPRPRGRGV